MKEDCRFCGVTFQSEESPYSDMCAECADEFSDDGVSIPVEIILEVEDPQ